MTWNSDVLRTRIILRLAILCTVVLLLCAVGARADIYDITFTDVTFTATCIGGGTCTEVINGSGLYDSVANTAWNLEIDLTGTLNASLDVYGDPSCSGPPGCLNPPVLYDTGTVSGFNPIEFAPILPTLNAPTPQPLAGGPSGSLLFVPNHCGGDNPDCDSIGTFPGNGLIDYQLTSGTYTSVDLGPSPVPEPVAAILVMAGLPVIGFLKRTARKRVTP